MAYTQRWRPISPFAEGQVKEEDVALDLFLDSSVELAPESKLNLNVVQGNSQFSDDPHTFIFDYAQTNSSDSRKFSAGFSTPASSVYEESAMNDFDDKRKHRKRAPTKKWTEHEDEILRRGVLRYTNEGRPVNYEEIARYIPGRSVKQAKERWKNSLNPTIRKGEWSQEELLGLLDLIIGKAQNWTDIQKKMSSRSMHCIKSKGRKLLGETLSKRLQKRCRGKKLKNWTAEEENKLVALHKTFMASNCPNLLNPGAVSDANVGKSKNLDVFEFACSDLLEEMLEEMCIGLSNGRPTAVIDRKLLALCDCRVCRVRKENLNKTRLELKTAWTQVKAKAVKLKMLREMKKNGVKLKSTASFMTTTSEMQSPTSQATETSCLDQMTGHNTRRTHEVHMSRHIQPKIEPVKHYEANDFILPKPEVFENNDSIPFEEEDLGLDLLFAGMDENTYGSSARNSEGNMQPMPFQTELKIEPQSPAAMPLEFEDFGLDDIHTLDNEIPLLDTDSFPMFNTYPGTPADLDLKGLSFDDCSNAYNAPSSANMAQSYNRSTRKRRPEREETNGEDMDLSAPVSTLRKIDYKLDQESQKTFETLLERALNAKSVSGPDQSSDKNKLGDVLRVTGFGFLADCGNEEEEKDESGGAKEVMTMVRNYSRSKSGQNNSLAKQIVQLFSEHLSPSQLSLLHNTMKKNNVEWLSPNVCGMLDELNLTPSDSDPRFKREYLCPDPTTTRFDQTKPVGTYVLNFLSKEIVDVDNSSKAIARGNMIHKHGWQFVPGRLEGLLRLYYLIPELMKNGEAWSFVRFFRCDGTQGIFLCLYTILSKKNMTCSIKFQDVTDQMGHVLSLPDYY